ncbi:MAG: protocatechuate 3,4-dioxygenase subunit alpha [Pseudomonadota bacterium]
MADMPGFGAMDPDDRGGQHEFRFPDDRAKAATPGPTPSQTVGPFFAYAMTPGAYGYPLREIHRSDMAGPDVAGMRITVEGQVFDANGQPVHDAMIELIQADSTGRYVAEPRNDGFTGFGRVGTGAQGPAEAGGDTRYLFRTVKPGATAPGHAPHLTLIVTMRGLLNHCITRVYFPEDAWADDPIVRQVPEARRHTLVAAALGASHYRFDIHMQGSRETVFFDI